MQILKRFAAVFSLFVVFVSCDEGPTEPGGVNSPNGFIAALQREGATVTRAEQMPRSSFPFFSVNAERLLVNGESVHTFDYSNESSASRDAQRISADGTSVGNSTVDWVSTPHFYKRSSMLVLYVGRSTETMRVLTTLLGPQIAGS